MQKLPPGSPDCHNKGTCDEHAVACAPSAAFILRLALLFSPIVHVKQSGGRPPPPIDCFLPDQQRAPTSRRKEISASLLLEGWEMKTNTHN